MVIKGTFTEHQQLATWLNYHGVDTTGWGKRKAKSIKDLFNELQKRESTLQLLGGKVFRCLGVVKMIVRQPGRPNRHLACYQQKMPDGRVRERNLLPSEKMFDGEVAYDAAMRGCSEEFASVLPVGNKLSHVDLNNDSLLEWHETTDSPSFPNLTTQYAMHQMTAIIKGLPSSSFTTTEKQGESETCHYWEWRQDSRSDLRYKPMRTEDADYVIMKNAGMESVANLVFDRVTKAPPLTVICLGGLLYAFVAFLFGCLLFALGKDCYYDEDDHIKFSFEQTLHMSVQIFATMGYSSLHPICTSSNFIVLLESYASVVSLATFGGYVIFILLKPRVRVRFSTHVLLCHGLDWQQREDQEDQPYLTFRLVRQSRTQLRDAELRVQAKFEVHGVRHCQDLKLQSKYVSSLDYWQAWHRIDERSPLWSMRAALRKHIKGLEVSLTAFDTTFMQVVKVYKAYSQADLVANSRFASMLTNRHNGDEIEVDHAKLDLYTSEERFEDKPEVPQASTRLSVTQMTKKLTGVRRPSQLAGLQEEGDDNSDRSRHNSITPMDAVQIANLSNIANLGSSMLGILNGRRGSDSPNPSADSEKVAQALEAHLQKNRKIKLPKVHMGSMPQIRNFRSKNRQDRTCSVLRDRASGGGSLPQPGLVSSTNPEEAKKIAAEMESRVEGGRDSVGSTGSRSSTGKQVAGLRKRVSDEDSMGKNNASKPIHGAL